MNTGDGFCEFGEVCPDWRPKNWEPETEGFVKYVDEVVADQLGYERGYGDGFEEGRDLGHGDGYEDGRYDGYDEGYAAEVADSETE